MQPPREAATHRAPCARIIARVLMFICPFLLSLFVIFSSGSQHPEGFHPRRLGSVLVRHDYGWQQLSFHPGGPDVGASVHLRLPDDAAGARRVRLWQDGWLPHPRDRRPSTVRHDRTQESVAHQAMNTPRQNTIATASAQRHAASNNQSTTNKQNNINPHINKEPSGSRRRLARCPSPEHSDSFHSTPLHPPARGQTCSRMRHPACKRAAAVVFLYTMHLRAQRFVLPAQVPSIQHTSLNICNPILAHVHAHAHDHD